jgi:hypothetical protein
MVSRDQAAKVVEMIDQGWHTVPRSVLTKVMGDRRVRLGFLGYASSSPLSLHGGAGCFRAGSIPAFPKRSPSPGTRTWSDRTHPGGSIRDHAL